MFDLSSCIVLSSRLLEAYRLVDFNEECAQEIIQRIPSTIMQRIQHMLEQDVSKRTQSGRIRSTLVGATFLLYDGLDGISKKMVHTIFAKFCGHSMLDLDEQWAAKHVKDEDKVSELMRSVETQFMFKQIADWAGRDPVRNRVFSLIIKFIYNVDGESTSLDLSNLELDCLPDIFMNSELRDRLIAIDLSCNRLTSLPSSFSLLGNLKKLDLKSNRLRSFPDLICLLRSLEDLNITKNPIVSFADSLQELRVLKRLTAVSCNLQELPEALSEITSLRELNLKRNQLTDLPSRIGNLSGLKMLDLSENRLTAVPQSLENMKELAILHLARNQIREVSPFLLHLRLLRHLVLDENPIQLLPDAFASEGNLLSLSLCNLELRSLPNSILSLGPHTNIFLQNCGLSRAIRRRITETMQAEGYLGPTFHVSTQRAALMHQKNLDEYLVDLCEKAFCPPKSLSSHYPQLKKMVEDPEKDFSLKDWLSRILLMQDGSRADAVGFYEKIISYLDLVERDPLFSDCFFSIIHDASETCGDRIALSVLHVGLKYKMLTFDKMDLKKFADFIIHGPWMINQLEVVARCKARTFEFVDEIEVFLAYPIMLKQRLKLEIDVDKMLYFSCSRITQADLDHAAEYIEDLIRSKDGICSILVDHDEWIQALKLSYPNQFEPIEGRRNEMLTLACESESSVDLDATGIEAVYKQHLIELTSKALRKRSYEEI